MRVFPFLKCFCCCCYYLGCERRLDTSCRFFDWIMESIVYQSTILLLLLLVVVFSFIPLFPNPAFGKQYCSPETSALSIHGWLLCIHGWPIASAVVIGVSEKIVSNFSGTAYNYSPSLASMSSQSQYRRVNGNTIFLGPTCDVKIESNGIKAVALLAMILYLSKRELLTFACCQLAPKRTISDD